MKKMTSIFLSLCMLCCFFGSVPAKAAEPLTSGDWEYILLKDGTVEITKYEGKSTDVTILETINGKTVTSIGDEAFLNSNIETITIPACVKNMNPDVFHQCWKLLSINIATDSENFASQDGILYNKDFTKLLYCPIQKRENLTIPDSVTSINDYAFYFCHIKGITLPQGLTDIGEGAFCSCTSLSDIVIPDSVTNIGEAAFMNDWSLKGINIPNGITSIKGETFACSGLRDIELPDSITSIGNDAFRSSQLFSINIPDNVTSIGNNAFYSCNLSSINIPGDVTSIGNNAFESCRALTSITIPSSVQSIGNNAFSNCSKKLVIHGEEGSKAQQYAEENKIKFKSLHKIILSKTAYTYNGKTKQPKVTVQDSKGNTMDPKDYTITFPENSKAIGQYTISISFHDLYGSTAKKTYQIIPKGTNISKLTAKKKGFTVKWKKQTKQTTGYEIQYATNKNFKGAKTITVGKNKTTSKTASKLIAGKKYYVRVRTYKTVKVNGKNTKIYSGWSKSKMVTAKR